MSETTFVGDLQVRQDLDYFQLESKIERASWVVMALALLAALAGVLGPGPLSRASAGAEGSPLRAEYNRIVRYKSPEVLRVKVHPEHSHAGMVRVWLNRVYVESIELKCIDPEPERVEAGPDRFTYTFNISDVKATTTLLFHFEPEQFGTAPVVIGLADGPELSFSQFMLP